MSCYSFGLLAGKDKIILYENVITSTLQQQHTLTGRSTPRTTACSLACVSNTPQQGVPWITTVGGCLSECCSSSVTNLAFGWVSQSTTVYNCEKNTCIVLLDTIQLKMKLMLYPCTCMARLKFILP